MVLKQLRVALSKLSLDLLQLDRTMEDGRSDWDIHHRMENRMDGYRFADLCTLQNAVKRYSPDQALAQFHPKCTELNRQYTKWHLGNHSDVERTKAAPDARLAELREAMRADIEALRPRVLAEATKLKQEILGEEPFDGTPKDVRRMNDGLVEINLQLSKDLRELEERVLRVKDRTTWARKRQDELEDVAGALEFLDHRADQPEEAPPKRVRRGRSASKN
jgi:hypothetical protein